jgi:hypothetical protein
MPGYSVTFTVIDNATKQIDQINRRISAMHAPIERMSRSVQKFIDVSGLRKIADGFNWIARAAGTVLRSLTAIVPVLGAITGAATITGMVKLVSSFAAWGNQLRTNADQIGITADELQKFQDATTRAGGNAEDMAETLKSLHTISADAFTGMNREAQSYFRRFGIDVQDANGHLKSATVLLPEVFKALDSLEDPADRSRVAAALLGDAQAKLYEEYKQSGKPLEDWLALEDKHQRATDEQLDQLNRYRMAQASLGTTFDQLGRQIAVVLANNFTPFLQHLDDFVQKNQPAIIAAIDNISKKFAAWLEKPETWKSFEDGAKTVIDSLVWISTHLDEIKTAAEVIAGIFATKWAVGMVASIAQVTTALGSSSVAGAGMVGGAGLLGALGAIAAIAAVFAGNRQGQKSIEEQAKGMGFEQRGGSLWNPFDKIPHFVNPTTGEDITYDEMMRRQGRPSGGGGFIERGAERAWKGPEAIQQQSLNLPADTTQRGAAITARLASDLNLTTAQAAGITGNLQAESGLQAVQERSPIGGGRGGFGWAQWTGSRRDEFEAYAKANNLDPKSDEANYGYLLHELQGPESAKMMAQLRGLQGPNAARDSAALVERQYERPAVSNAGVRGGYAEQFAQAPPAAPPAQAPPINGAVSVDITHRNPPPDATVTAQGSGAVNVAPPRTEHPQLDFTTA